MALNDQVLEDYFKKSRKSSFPLVSRTRPSSTRFRVFDDPTRQKITDKDKENGQNKSRTNLGQTTDNTNSNLRQIEDKSRTNLNHEIKKLGQNQDKYETIPRTNIRANLGQILEKRIPLNTFSSLVGLQRKITQYIYESCQYSLEKITPPTSIQHVAIYCETTELSVQKTIQRLEKKGILRRAEFKAGRSGWTRYELPEMIYQEILYTEKNDKIRTNLGQNQDKSKTQPRTKFRTIRLSSSSSINNKRTTTDNPIHKSEEDSDVFSSWETIDMSLLKDIGFTKNHLLQIASQGILSSEVVQHSIQAFSFDLCKNKKGESLKTNPLNYFMGILRRGHPYAPPSNYESPQDYAWRIYIEKQKNAQEKREQMENEALDLTFKEWLEKLPKEEKEKLIPEHTLKLKIDAPKISALRAYFRENVWPQKRIEIFTKGDAL